jgi:phosphonate transport system substrate-binding protein
LWESAGIFPKLIARSDPANGIDMNKFSSVLAGLLVFCCLSCQSKGEQSPPASAHDVQRQDIPASAGPPITISILPAESAGTMYKRFLPLKYHLEKSLGIPITIKIAKDYETAIQEIGTGQVRIAFLDPSTYCEVRTRYHGKVVPLVRVVGARGAPSRSVLVTRSGSAIHKVADVRGKRLALGSQRSSFSYLIPLAMLHDVGIEIRDFSSVDYLQQEDRVALSVLINNHDVGAISESVAQKYAPDGIKIIKTSESVPRFVLCASTRLPEEMRKRIIASLTSLREDEKNRPLADSEIGAFVTAEDRDFDVIRVMMKNLTGKDYIEYGPRTIKVAVLPLYSTITIFERYEPLMRYLTRKTGHEFKIVVPKNFEDFMKVVESGAVNFSYQNPYIFSVIAKDVDMQPLVTTIGDDSALDEGSGGETFRGVIITRAESKIRSIDELRNKRVLITSPKSAGGYLSQKIFLQKQGMNVERDMKIIDAKKQENVILGVYRGEADAGFVRESALVVWKDAVDMNQLRVLARTEPLPNWPFALCGRTDPALVKKVTRLLSELSDKEVLGAAKIRGFKETNGAEFEALKRY